MVLIFALFANKAEASQPQMAKFADTIQKTYYSADLGKYRCVEDSVSNTETTVTCDNSGDFIYTFRKIRDGNKFDLLEVTLRRTGFQILKIYDSREGTAIFYWDNSSKEGSLVRTIIDIETISFDAIVEFAGLLLENVASSSTFKGDKTFSHFLWQSYVEHGDKAGIAALRGIKNSVVTTGEFLGESVAWVLYGEVVEDAKNFAKSLGHLARHPEIIKKIAYDKKTEFLQASPEKQAELIGHLAGDIEQAIL